VARKATARGLAAHARIGQSAAVDPGTEIRFALERTRDETDGLLKPLSDEALSAPVPEPGLPLVWVLADIGRFEELWLLRSLDGQPPLAERHDDVYEALRAERTRAGRPVTPRASDVRAYVDDVRERALEALARTDFEAPDPLLRKRFVFGLVLQHELQAQERLLQTIQLRTEVEYPGLRDAPRDRAPSGPEEISVPEGSFTLGAVDEPWALDNELVAHEVDLPAFRIDRLPVTNAEFAQFVADRGYRSRRAWSDPGWEWREREGVEAPLYWENGDGSERIRFGHREPLPPDEPVQHVSYWEAEAFARWAGKRLPTEAEWERAAGWDLRRGKMRFPWGQESMGYEANLGHRRFSPAPAGSYGGGVSPVGCVQMAGDVWEWTSSSFQAYPGFLPFPYPELSEIYFGDEYRVLRGGSWATDPIVARTSLRNWEDPGSRHVFAGFRCARDD
jgi:gamma-glutamyl hercynylcysteine S-oxide synthase